MNYYPHFKYADGQENIDFIKFKTNILKLSTIICEPLDYDSVKLMTYNNIHQYFSLNKIFKYFKAKR